MTGLILLTLRELRARKVVVGLFVVATAVWFTLALALQVDVVDGSLAGMRVFGNDAFEESPRSADPVPGTRAAPPLDRDTLNATDRATVDSLQTDSLQTGALVRAGSATMGAKQDVTQEDLDAPFRGANPLESLVFSAQAFVAGAAYWVGILLCLFATGGLVASLVEPGQADLLVAKPLSRSAILGGRLAGVGVVTAALLTYLLGAVWIVMAAKTGIWSPRFLLAIPAVWAMFAVLYGVVTLVSVWSGSGPLALVVTLGLMFITIVLAIPGLEPALDPLVRPLVAFLGDALPRFATVGANLVPHLATGSGLSSLVTTQPDAPSLVADAVPLATSLVFGAVCYAAAFRIYHCRDV